LVEAALRNSARSLFQRERDDRRSLRFYMSANRFEENRACRMARASPDLS
jgi:hypothetical protein